MSMYRTVFKVLAFFACCWLNREKSWGITRLWCRGVCATWGPFPNIGNFSDHQGSADHRQEAVGHHEAGMSRYYT